MRKPKPWFTSFETFKSTVDLWLKGLCGLTSDDLPDYDYWKAFQDRVNPKTTAKRAIKAAKEF